MAAINVNRVEVLNNPAPFSQPFAFEIEYECLTELQHDLEWKMIYVGSAESEKYDQVLDEVCVGPVYPGSYKFVFEGNPPDHTKLVQTDIVGVTVVLLTCSYKGKEFIRIGYYLSNEYEQEDLRETPPEVPLIDKLTRVILASDPRVTRFPNEFDNPVIVDNTNNSMMEGGAAPDGSNEWQEGSMMDMDNAPDQNMQPSPAPLAGFMQQQQQHKPVSHMEDVGGSALLA